MCKHHAKNHHSKVCKKKIWHALTLVGLIALLVFWHEEKFTLSACALKFCDLLTDVVGDRLFPDKF